LKFEPGAVVLDAAVAHVSDAAQVLSRYVDLVGIRAFPKLDDWEEVRKDEVLQSWAKDAQVPVMNMQTITHPYLELAVAMALQEHMGSLDGKKFVLTWSYHPRPLNTAVANSALMISSKMGMDVTLLVPTEEFVLDERYMSIRSEEHTSEL